MDAKEMLKRTKQFGYDCIDLSEHLYGSFMKIHIRNQLIRSSTSVSCNYRAARVAQSTASFVSKVSIAIEEADESEMWLEMLIDKNLLSINSIVETKRLKREANELTSILIATRKTLQKRLSS